MALTRSGRFPGARPPRSACSGSRGSSGPSRTARVEKYAAERGYALVTEDVIDEVRSALPIDFAKRKPFFLRGTGLETPGLDLVVCDDSPRRAWRSRAGGGRERPARVRFVPWIGSRTAVWIAAEVHLMFAAFVLGVPMFAVVAEGIGSSAATSATTGSPRNSLVSFSSPTARPQWGAVLVFFLTTLYPRFWAHMTEIFEVSMWIYVGLFFVESFTLYLYYYGWDRWKKGRGKIGHWTLGILLNVWGTAVLFIADSWLTYMMSPPAGRGARHLTRHGPVLERVRERDLDAHQHPPSDRQRGVRRVGGRRLRGYRFLSLRRPTKSAPTTTGWATWGT